jgi:diaminopimelate decarboxylase
MKPAGAIPTDFLSSSAELRIGGDDISRIIAQAGDTPLFAYDAEVIRRRVERFRAAMPSEVGLHYAVKANPYAPILTQFASLVDGFDVASGGEMDMALAAEMPADRISMAGPGKRDRELTAAIGAGITINLESEGEAARALSIAAQLGMRPRLAIRVNPSFEIKGSGMRMGGGAKPFGVDAERVPELVRALIAEGADWRGFHVFAGSQALDGAAIIASQRATIDLVTQLSEAAGASPPLVNLGGGFGIPYFAGEQPLNIEAIGEELALVLNNRLQVLVQSRFAIELGRWLVGEAGVYLTRVIDRKQSHGETFLIVDGGLHHQLAASGNFGTVVRRNYPIAIANRFDAEPEEEVTVVGCLCTPLDRLADKVLLPRAEVGDIVAIFMAGAYGLTASPSAFLGHPLPKEIMVDHGFAA